ncbi:tyrosine-type recombinase/integrase [Arthrobacter sp. NA-172]|uniref:tyrosine-type recombinase/integrase n=1 Tax=Arthrobacter sp. NA-172 TaxID=3367524 RepID=UPI00375485B4
MPEVLQLLHYTRQSIPGQYLRSFAYYHDKIGNVHLDGLPETMQRELMFVIWRIIDMGGRVPCASLGLLCRELAETSRRLKSRGLPSASLMDRTPGEWRTELNTTWARRIKALPNASTMRTIAGPLDRACKLLWFAYDDSPWWEREVWSLDMDPRIPRREQEPARGYTIHWHDVEPQWLRRGAMFYVKTLLESGRATWTTVMGQKHSFRLFGTFVTERGLASPRLAEDETKVRAIMMDFLTCDSLRSASGRQRSHSTIAGITAAVRGLYGFMHDHGEDAASATGDPRWAGLSPEYLRFWRPGDVPRFKKQAFTEDHLFSDQVLSRIAAQAPLLAAPQSEGGFGDPQAMRILLLMIATGRRLSEICMLDANPLLPVTGPEPKDGTRIAKLCYQQTKIEGAPETIFVDSEVIEIIAEQQRWLKSHLEKVGITDPPAYLFLKDHNNLHCRHHYYSHVFRRQMEKLVQRAELKDDDGQPLKLSKTHRFRHTKATSLINAGVPLHVVQRYMGHASPEMTMHYAQTLDSTAKAEFLKYRKITTNGEGPGVSPEDLYDLMALDSRTDRVLPNGWCTLPPTKSCDKGNACLGCDLFVTDERFLNVHEGELVALDSLIDKRQEAHTTRTGEPMSENHVWLTLRRREQGALGTIIETLKGPDRRNGPVKGPGTAPRAEADIAKAPRQVAR